MARKLKDPWRIVRDGRRRRTADGRFIVFARFGLLWVARRPCACPGLCYCDIAPMRLPGGVAGEAFGTLKGLQAALRTHYAKKGWG